MKSALLHKIIFSSVFFCSFFILTACSISDIKSVNIEEEWPEPPSIQKIVQPEAAKEQSLVIKQEDEQEVSLVEKFPRKVSINETVYLFELMDFIDDKPRIRISEFNANETKEENTTRRENEKSEEIFIIELNETFIFSRFEWSVFEVVYDAVPIPRKSWVDISFLGSRKNVYVNENKTFGNKSVMVDFVGLREDVASARIVVGGESAILSQKEEHRFEDGFLYVRGVYFNDATEISYANAITLKARIIG